MLKYIGKYRGINFKGLYGIDSSGFIISYRNPKKTIKLKPYTDGKRGYLKVRLYAPTGESLDVYIHLLVMKFFGPRKYRKNLECNHKDNNKKNNDISNLEWLTPLANVRHSINIKAGKRSRCMDIDTVHEICELLAQNIKVCHIAKIFNRTRTSIQKIKCKKNYAYISDQYF